MNNNQGRLFDVTDHSNRGLSTEKQLIAAHDYYRLQGIADVVKNPSEWIYISEAEYRRLKEKQERGGIKRGTLAVTDDLRKMRRVPSDVDFAGGGKCSSGHFAICFDAKESAGMRIPLANFKEHQIRRLLQSARCGNIAGFMIRMSDHDRMFFAAAQFIEKRYTDWIKQTYGNRKAKPGTASISVEELEANAIEIFRHRTGGFWDWHGALVK